MAQHTSFSVIELARRGHSEAINQCLNYIMQKLGVAARVIVKPVLVEMIIEKMDGIPDEVLSMSYIQGFFEYLQLSTVQQVKVYAKHPGSNRLVWFNQLALNSYKNQTSVAYPSSPPKNLGHPSMSRQPSTLLVQPKINKPIPFEDLPDNLRKRIKRAGLRPGETRSWKEAEQLYEKMPENVRRRSVKVVDEYKRNHDWSHKKAHANGGSSNSNNGDWEVPEDNRARGSRNITQAEQQAIAKAKASSNFQAGSKIVLNQATIAGGVAFGIELAFSGLDNFMAVQRGEKSVEEALVSTLASSTGAAVTTFVITGGIVTLALVFPPIGTALTAVSPYLQVVGAVAGMKRLIAILTHSGKVDGIDRVTTLLASYGIDEVDLDFRDLEIDNELSALKSNLGLA